MSFFISIIWIIPINQYGHHSTYTVLLDWNQELKVNSKNAVIVPPQDRNAPNAPISQMFDQSVSDFTTNQGGGQYVPQTLTAPEFSRL